MAASSPKGVLALALASALAHDAGPGRRLLVAAADERDHLRRLATVHDGDGASAGALFDVKAKAPLVLRGLDLYADGGDAGARVEVWTKAGRFRGHDDREEAWTLWINATLAPGGRDAPTHVAPRSGAVALAANERRAFYVALPAGGRLRHSGRGDHRRYYINRDLVIYGEGAAKERGFGGARTSPRWFNGAVYYDAALPDEDRSGRSRSERGPPPADARTLATTFASTNTYAGGMFDVLARDDLEVRSLAFHTYKTVPIAVRLYTKEGSYRGCEGSLARWTLVASATVRGQGLGGPTFLPEGAFDPIAVRRNRRQAFYVTSDGPYLRASKGTSEGEIAVANEDLVVYEGVGKRYPVAEATFAPRRWNGILRYQLVELPTSAPVTAAPTAGPTDAPTKTPTPRPTPPAPPPMPADFRLRLYWEPGYRWQEDRSEQWFCMECRDNCKSGDSVYVDGCGASPRQRFVAVGATLRPAHDRALCLTVTGHSADEPIRVHACREARAAAQSFAGFKARGRFELQPRGDATRCVSQMHHPKDYERVYPEECTKTRSHDTTYWVTY